MSKEVTPLVTTIGERFTILVNLPRRPRSSNKRIGAGARSAQTIHPREVDDPSYAVVFADAMHWRTKDSCRLRDGKTAALATGRGRADRSQPEVDAKTVPRMAAIINLPRMIICSSWLCRRAIERSNRHNLQNR